jgi:DNA polymerase
MHEDLEGRPFVGKAGQLLDACLAEQTIDRRHIYITNVVRCRPTLQQGTSVRNRPPTTDEMSACLPWLQQTIAVIQPLVILCLGAPSAKTIIKPDFRITQERGQWFANDYAPNIIASWHPSYVMRMHGEAHNAARAQLVGDIADARQRVKEVRRRT